MIRAVITNEMLDRLLAIERAKAHFGDVRVPVVLSNRLRKSSKKKSSYASNRIEGNPLTEAQSDSVIDGPTRRHYLKPEQEIKNYFDALNFLEGKSITARCKWACRRSTMTGGRIRPIRKAGCRISCG